MYSAYLSPPQNVKAPWRAQESHNVLCAARESASPGRDELGGVGGRNALCVGVPFIFIRIWSVRGGHLEEC